MRTPKLPLCAALCVLAAAGCGGDDSIPLFAEEGTWALFLYDLEGKGLEPIDVMERVDQFLINFNPDKEIVATATCKDSMGRTDLTKTICDVGQFACRCFNYTFEESTMVWTEFEANGAEVPPVPPEESLAAKPGEGVTISLEDYPETSNTYRYSALPYGLFNSDGETSKYVFQVRGNTLFAATGCLEICGSASEAPAGE